MLRQAVYEFRVPTRGRARALASRKYPARHTHPQRFFTKQLTPCHSDGLLRQRSVCSWLWHSGWAVLGLPLAPSQRVLGFLRRMGVVVRGRFPIQRQSQHGALGYGGTVYVAGLPTEFGRSEGELLVEPHGPPWISFKRCPDKGLLPLPWQLIRRECCGSPAWRQMALARNG